MPIVVSKLHELCPFFLNNSSSMMPISNFNRMNSDSMAPKTSLLSSGEVWVTIKYYLIVRLIALAKDLKLDCYCRLKKSFD